MHCEGLRTLKDHLRAKGSHFEDALHGEHGGEDEVEVGENVHEL